MPDRSGVTGVTGVTERRLSLQQWLFLAEAQLAKDSQALRIDGQIAHPVEPRRLEQIARRVLKRDREIFGLTAIAGG